MASTPRVIINNSIYKQRQGRNQEEESAFASRSYPARSTRHSRLRPRVTQPNPPNTTPQETTPDRTMCVKEIFTEVRPDGRLKTWEEGDFCAYSRHGQFCERTQELRRPPGYRRESRSPTYNHGQLPPTPPLSYHSDYTSDSERSSRRRSGIYISDNKMLDVNSRRSRHERQGSGERGAYLSSSPLSRTLSHTPPRHRHSISLSPATDYDTYESGRRDTETRPRERAASIKVEIINERPKSSHHRAGSSSKTSSSRDSSDEERRQRRLSEAHPGDHQRQRQKETEIARQNQAIAKRSPVPTVSSSPARYRRGSVSIPPVVTVPERIRSEEEKRQRQREKKEAEAREREIEAQRLRLKDRFNLKAHYP